MTFFPQEDAGQLASLRSRLTPFLQAVASALAYELETASLDFETKALTELIFNEILQNLPAENSSATFGPSWLRASGALHYEFDHFLVYHQLNVQ